MRRSALAQLLALATALFGAIGCEQILNVDGIKIGRQPALTGPADSVPDAAPPVCVAGQLHCEGVALQICLPDLSGFRTARVCSTPELCCDGPQCGAIHGCLPPACAPGDFRCEGSTLSVCNDGQTGWTPIDECATAAQCNSSLGRCTDQPCDAVTRELQCNGATLEQCGQPPGWRVIETCETPALCKTGIAEVECAPTGCVIDANQLSPFQCTYGDLMRCNDAQTGFEHVETCLNATRCFPLIEELAGDPYAPVLSSQDLLALGCRAANCSPGRYKCEPTGALMRCNADLTGYLDRIDVCASAAHCNAAAGRCDEVPCTENTTQCSGGQYQRCTGGRWQDEAPCASGARCDHVQGCTPAVCEANEYRCDGRELMRCNVNLDGWIPVHSCDTEVLCNAAAKRCDQPVCAEGQRRCNRDGALLECSSGRDAWRTLEDCGGAIGAGVADDVSAACDPTGGGRCVGQASCAPGALRCNGQFLERCRDNTWVPRERCATAALCDASGMGSCLAPTCQPGSYQCVAPGANSVPAAPGAATRGLLLQRCNAGGTGYELYESCSAEEFCDATHGQCDLCDAREPPFCNGNELSLCTADGQERMLQRVCPLGCVTPEPPGPPACREGPPSTAAADPSRAPEGGS